MTTYTADDLALLAAVTKVLNRLPDADGFYVRATLHDVKTHKQVGAWETDDLSSYTYAEEA